VVREGDTLLGIAINFGVEVADLQTANEGLDPRALQIGQQLIIPPPRAEASETSVTDNTLPTSTPAALTLQAPSCFPSQVGGMMCLGEVQNTLNIPLERVAIAVQMLAADGTPIQEVVAIVEQRIIPIGGTAPYRAQLNANQNDVRLDTVLLSADEAQRVEQRFIVLQVLDEQVVYEQGRYIISARVRNPDVVNALAVRATLTILGANGRVLGYRVAQVRDVIAPGEDAPLQMDVIPQVADDAATHTLYVEAQRGAE
jgi:murein DD-endopeptidase MepM/ murein hydrolase activator NlpD